MDWMLGMLVIFAAFVLQSESKPVLLDADYTDDDLIAEESQAYGFGYGPPPVCHRHPHPHPHGRHPYPPQYPGYQPAPFGPFFPQPNFGYPHFNPPPPHYGKQPHFHGHPKGPHQTMQPNQPLMPNNGPFNEPMQPDENSSTTISPVVPASPTVPIDTGSITTTTEEPVYDIDIRFKD